MRGEAQELRIPRRCGGVLAGHAFTALHDGVLDVARVIVVIQIFGDLRVCKAGAETGAPTEEEGHADAQPGGVEEEHAGDGGHWAARACMCSCGCRSRGT